MTKYGLPTGPISTVESNRTWACYLSSSGTFTYNNIRKMLRYAQVCSGMLRYAQVCSGMFRYIQIRHECADNLGAKENFISRFKDMTSQVIKV